MEERKCLKCSAQVFSEDSTKCVSWPVLWSPSEPRFQQRMCSADVCAPVGMSGRGLCVQGVHGVLSTCQVPLRDGWMQPHLILITALLGGWSFPLLWQRKQVRKVKGGGRAGLEPRGSDTHALSLPTTENTDSFTCPERTQWPPNLSGKIHPFKTHL